MSDHKDTDNFVEALNRFQGKKLDISIEFMEKLDEYFISKGEKLGAEVRNLPLVNGKRGRLSLRDLYQALKYMNQTEYYEHVNLITKIYWGWELPDINSEKLLKQYDEAIQSSEIRQLSDEFL